MIWLVVLFVFSAFSPAPVNAGGIDDANIKELISKSKIVPGLTYGRETKRIILTEDWTIPQWDQFSEAYFRFFVMTLDVLKTPIDGRYRIDNIVAANKGSYKKGDEILAVLLHRDISYDTFKHWIFRPWLKFNNKGSSKEWYFVKIGGQWYGKPLFAISRSLITSVENFRDFICNGPEDPDFIEINGNSITVAKLRNLLCFHVEHNDLYIGRKIERPEAFNISVNGNPLKEHFDAKEKTTFEITPIPENMPEAWVNWGK